MFPDLPATTATNGISEPARIERECVARIRAGKVGGRVLNVEHEC